MEVVSDTPQASQPFTLQDFPVYSPPPADVQEHRIVGFDSRDRRSRAFNLLRTSLSKKLAERRCRFVGLTSATPAAGKSFLSMNLAASLARIFDDPVYLVDLDLRRSSLAQQIGLEPGPGVASVLSGDTPDLASAGLRLGETNLVLFPTGEVTGNSAEILSGSRFDDFMSSLRERTTGSIVLFDLPPAFASDDTMLVAQKLDGYILVADSGRTTKRQLREVLRIMEPTPCVGTILNRYRGGLADEYGYGYGSSAYANYYD